MTRTRHDVDPAVWPIVGAATMRALDAHTIEELGVPGEILMESAGRAVVEVVLREWSALPRASRPEVLVVCGTGNNGGDGFVVARHLVGLGVPLKVALIGEANKLRGDAAANLTRLRALGVDVTGDRWRAPQAGVVVDAIFGTGLTRAVGGAAQASIRRINQAREANAALRVVAVDVPSGVCSDTGQRLADAVAADITLCIEIPKLGLILEPGRSLAGRVEVARVGIARTAPDTRIDAHVLTAAAAGARLPARPAAGHKGTFGHALIVAGSEGKTGAAALAATAAGRAGAGLVTVACPAGIHDILEIKCTEAMTVPVADTPRRALAAEAEGALVGLAAERDAVGLGPGLGRDAETLRLVTSLAKQIEAPLALDADGLRPFTDQPELLAARSRDTVLTPHPGEAAHLLSTSSDEINADRVGAARRLAERTGSVVLLKGASSVIADPSGELVVNPTGGPALSTGGTGDVLLGMVTALLAQGVPGFEAAALGAYWHGAAADALAQVRGGSGLLAGDLLDELPRTAERLREAVRGLGRAAPRETRLAADFPGT
ncbi:MAG: NAD(P)H-hydrate dehydratase [Myxococcales bacterium]|nr:NAD(P)H-hydrate dehydratase [Myxococcales bacterium]